MFCLRPCLIRQSNGKLIYADQYCLQTWKPPVGFWTLDVMALVINNWSSPSRWHVNMQPVNIHGAAKIKNFFSGSGRELRKILVVFIDGGFTTRSHPCFLLFCCNHPNGALMRTIILFKNVHVMGKIIVPTICSGPLPSLSHFTCKGVSLLKYFRSNEEDLACSLQLVYHWFKLKWLKVLDYFPLILLIPAGMEGQFRKCFIENRVWKNNDW